jgi:hypothetical protein
VVPIPIPTGVLLEWLRKLINAPKESRKQRLNDIHQPLFDAFLVVHGQYMTMLGDLRKALISVIVGQSGTDQVIEAIHNEFKDKRREDEGQRTKIRSLSDSLINATLDELEERFILALLCYLLSHDTPYKSRDDLDRNARLLRESGYGALFETPSSYALGVLSSEKDPTVMEHTITGEMERLSGYLSVVCTAFSDLKVAVYT